MVCVTLTHLKIPWQYGQMVVYSLSLWLNRSQWRQAYVAQSEPEWMVAAGCRCSAGERGQSQIVRIKSNSQVSQELSPVMTEWRAEVYLFSSNKPISGHFLHCVHSNGGYAQHRRDGHHHHLAHNNSNFSIHQYNTTHCQTLLMLTINYW